MARREAKLANLRKEIALYFETQNPGRSFFLNASIGALQPIPQPDYHRLERSEMH